MKLNVKLPTPVSASALAMAALLAVASAISLIQIKQQEVIPPAYVPHRPFVPMPPASDETANWKTYTNTKYKFSFRHPNLSPEVCDVGSPAIGKRDRVLALCDETTIDQDEYKGPFDGFSIYVIQDYGLNFQNFMDKEKEEQVAVAQENPVERSFVVNGRPAVSLTFPRFELIYVLFPDNQKILYFGKVQNSPESFKSFDQILSTLTFLQ